MNNTVNHPSSTKRLHVLSTLVQKVDAGLLDLLNQRANLLKTIAHEQHGNAEVLQNTKPLLEKEKHTDLSEDVVQSIWNILNSQN